MKSFFSAIVNIFVTVVMSVYDYLKSFQIKRLAADIAGVVKSFFPSSDDYDDSGSKKKIILVASVAAILVAIACIKLFWPSSPGAERIKLTPAATQDANGDRWSLQLLKGQSSQIVAQAGVKPGPPLLVKPDVAAQGGIFEIGVTVQGQAGEKYVPGVQRNDKWLPPPKYRLIGENGQILAAGQFEYG